MEITFDNLLWLNRISDFVTQVPKYLTVNQDTKGFGIVICAGHRHFCSALITINILEKQNNNIPIEWYYVGDELIEFQIEYLKSKKNIKLINCLDIIPSWFNYPINTKKLKGYMIKPFALMMSNFENILLLDGDNIPLCNVFEIFQCETFLEYGNVFWKDVKFSSKKINKQMLREGYHIYELLNIKDIREYDYGLAESGQILINKKKCWKALCVSYFLNYHHEVFYKLFFGDKDLYYVAFELTNTFYFQNKYYPYGIGLENQPFGKINMLIQRIPDGHPNGNNGGYAFLHRTLSKINANKFDIGKYIFKNIDYPLDSIDDGMNIWANDKIPCDNYIFDDFLTKKQFEIKNEWNKIRELYTKNINNILNYHKDNIQNNVQQKGYFFDVINLKELESNLMELSIYVNKNVFHFNYCMIFYYSKKKYQKVYDIFIKLVRMNIENDDSILIIMSTVLRKNDLFLILYKELKDKYKIFLLSFMYHFGKTSLTDIKNLLDKEDSIFLKKFKKILDIKNPNLLNFNYILDNIEIIPSFKHPIYLDYFYYFSFNDNNNLEIKKKISKLHRIMFPSINYVSNLNINQTNNLENIPLSMNNVIYGNNGRIKIGFISTNFKDHSVARDRTGIILNLYRDIFDITIFYFNKFPNHIYFNKLWNSGNKNVLLSGSIHQQIKQIEIENIQILIYCDIGMQSETYLLAHCRIAPIQITTWGHSETTGIDTIDYYVSSSLYEVDSENHYSEKLILHKSLCTFYYDRYYDIYYRLRNIEYTLPLENNVKYLLYCQSLHKISDHDLTIFKRIFDKIPKVKIAFVNSCNMNESDVVDTFRKIEIYKNRILIIPRLKVGNLYDLIQKSYLILDSYPQGGCNTSLECFYYNKIIITKPSKYLRGRFTYGFYYKMNILDCIVNNINEYVNKVKQLVYNEEYKNKLENRIKTNKHKLFNDTDSVHEWSNTLREIYLRSIG